MATEVLSAWSDAVAFTVVGEDWPTVEYGKIFPNDLVGSEIFGRSVAMDGTGTNALVGAPYDDSNGTNAGAVHYYTRVADQWTRVGKFFASDASVDDNFGTSVAISNDGLHALVGSHNDDDTATSSGSVYYFTRTGDVWTQVAKLHASDAAASDYFGASCALNTDATIALIGAIGDDDTASGSGSVYYFTRVGSVWTQQGKINASDPTASANFGFSVALNDDGTKALVGSNKSGAESFYYFTRAGSVWTQASKINATASQLGANFGHSIALNGAGDIAAIGATNHDVTKGSAVYTNTGGVYIYRFITGVWTQQTVLVSSDPENSQYFGTGVCLDATGAMALIGAHGDDSRAGDTGAVYFFN